MRSKNKEVVIVLPNRDECPAGKTKDESKLLSLVTAEYDMADDISYFQLHKEKNRYLLKLVFIPGHLDEIQTANGKKFVMFELIKNGANSVFRLDEDLNKRMATILGLLNSDDPNSKETIRAKLSDIIDGAGQLDHIVDTLLSDAQFNSFKYTVLNTSSKSSCLMCVNSSGVSVRAIEPPYEVQDHLGWADIRQIATKNKRVIVTKSDGQSQEICCLTKKAAHAVQRHLRLYLGFMGSAGRVDRDHPPVSPVSPLSWIGRISQRLRKSFGRNPATGSGGDSRPAASPAADKPTSSPVAVERRQFAAPPSTVPDSSFISEDVMDAPISSNVEPSLKTNSTYDVSLGSDSSYRPTITSLSNEELSNNGERTSARSRLDHQYPQQQQHAQYQHQYQQGTAVNDDHLSFKTTSTYEVSLDSRHMVRPMTTEHDSLGSSSGGPLSSFSPPPPQTTGTSPAKADVPLPVRRGDSVSIHASSNVRIDDSAVEHLGASVLPVATDNTAYQLRYEEPAADRYYSTRPGTTTVSTTDPSSTTTPPDTGRVMFVKPVVMTTAQSTHVTPGPPTAKILPEVPVRTVTADTGNTALVPELSVSTVADTPVVSAAVVKVSAEGPVMSIVPVTDTKVPVEIPALESSFDKSLTVLPEVDSEPVPGPVAKSVPPEPPIRTESERPVEEKPIVAIDTTKAMAEPRLDHRPLEEPTPVETKMTPPIEAVADPWPPALLTVIATDATSDETGQVALQSEGPSKLENGAPLTVDLAPPPPQVMTQHSVADRRISEPQEPTRSDRPDVLDLSAVYNNGAEPPTKQQPADSKLPVSKSRSIPSPKVQRPSRVPTREVSSPKRGDVSLQSSMLGGAQSPSDKENYQNDNDNDDEEDSTQDSSSISIDKPPTANFSRFEGQEYRVDSKTTITTVSTVGDNVVKRSTQTEIATLKSTGIPTPKQYKSTTTIISTVKKPADVSKSPSNSATKIPTGIPRMSSK